MKKIIVFLILIFMVSCHEDEILNPISSENQFNINIENVPFQKLSEYRFFINNIKDQNSIDAVLPFSPASGLFTNYAKKKRFVYIPNGKKVYYNGDDKTFDFPSGTILIKTFYYENVAPANTLHNIETRILVNKNGIWNAYNYIWNEEQTDALLDIQQQGITKNITWIENGVTKNVDYKIPSQIECVTCHKIDVNSSNNSLSPIGTKPQNLNSDFQYYNGKRNQILEWKNKNLFGNLIPSVINSTVNWEDETQSLEMRSRSYLDANCAHCHRENGYCDYAPQRFNFSNTNLNILGVCLPSSNILHGKYILQSGNADKSAAINRMKSNLGSVKMPIIGRNIVHEEGVLLISNWMNSLPKTCN